MSAIEHWISRWSGHVHPQAIAELKELLLAQQQTEQALSASAEAAGANPGSESRQQSLVRLEAARLGVFLARNNVGALPDERGVPVRYGLMNESKAQNQRIKSSDLIGWRTRHIVQADVGTKIAQVVAREVKHEGWVYKGDKHEQAQLRFIEFMLAAGGDAAFCTGPGSFDYILR